MKALNRERDPGKGWQTTSLRRRSLNPLNQLADTSTPHIQNQKANRGKAGKRRAVGLTLYTSLHEYLEYTTHNQ